MFKILINHLTSCLTFVFCLGVLPVTAQNADNADSLTIEGCIRYALLNQPYMQQLGLDEKIAGADINLALSDWLPQISTTAGIQHFLKQPVSLFPDFSNPSGPKIEITTGVANNSSLQATLNQNIFKSDLYFAGRAARYYRQQSRQLTSQGRIQLVVDVSKAFYDILLDRQLLQVEDEQLARLKRSLEDASAMYRSGITDRIDYSRATISLNNTMAQRLAVQNSLKAKITYLKQLMGYPDARPLSLKYDFSSMKNEVLMDTVQVLNYDRRIEYQLLQTNLRLKQMDISRYKYGFLPTLSGFLNYNINYQNENFGSLYDKSYPNSLAGLTLSFPIFEGARRLDNLKKSRLEYQRLTLDTLRLKDEINTEMERALASYKSNLALYRYTEENIMTASDVYNTIRKQYTEGIKSYLEVIISETDLQTAKIENLRALISLMYSKIDVQQAAGAIKVDY